uniref:Uncharacterized protein n=1 Tax=Physcomitrium patens TaxID=3218 RepID=A0A2K1LBS0_PHYPA|nr:hypothetical protein PHYPA_001887 [Physcomitrium patens]
MSSPSLKCASTIEEIHGDAANCLQATASLHRKESFLITHLLPLLLTFAERKMRSLFMRKLCRQLTGIKSSDAIQSASLMHYFHHQSPRKQMHSCSTSHFTREAAHELSLLAGNMLNNSRHSFYSSYSFYWF